MMEDKRDFLFCLEYNFSPFWFFFGGVCVYVCLSYPEVQMVSLEEKNRYIDLKSENNFDVEQTLGAWYICYLISTGIKTAECFLSEVHSKCSSVLQLMTSFRKRNPRLVQGKYTWYTVHKFRESFVCEQVHARWKLFKFFICLPFQLKHSLYWMQIIIWYTKSKEEEN